VGANSDIGPVINKQAEQRILAHIEHAKKQGVEILCGGNKEPSKSLKEGYYIQPTIFMNPSPQSQIGNIEIFGPVTCIFTIDNISDAIKLTNQSEYGLTSSIHTSNINTSLEYTDRVRAGLVNVNLGTHGSEPHMPFGGFGVSGNGSREPGVEALDVYSELKNISFFNLSYS